MSAARTPAVRLERLACVESCVAPGTRLHGALAEAEPWLAEWLTTVAANGGATSADLPLPHGVVPFAELPYFRPPGSHRCFYYSPPPSQAVVAFKGLEPCASDFETLLAELDRPCYSPHNILEHFVFEEHKVPGCVTLFEARREAARAVALQTAHADAYGSLARLPLPLFVLAHSEQTVQRVTDTLRPLLSEAALVSLKPALTTGLGVYVYYYPATPVRARELDTLLQGTDFRARTLSLLHTLGDPEEILGRWVQLFARMLHLGFLPAALGSLRTGSCCQPQNACLDGGFVDLDSLTPFSDLPDDTAVYAALELSTASLLETVRTLVVGSLDPTRSEDVKVRVDLHHLRRYVLAAVERALVTEALPGREVDPRVTRYFTPAASYAELVTQLNPYYGAPSPAFDAAARDYLEFGLERMAALRRS
jgi:hypothetical protein